MTSAPHPFGVVADDRPARRRRRTLAIAVLVVILATAVALTIVVARTMVPAPTVAFAPGADDGLIMGGHTASIDDIETPAIARLEPALRDALAQATASAAAEGIALRITSGWRSRAYQEWLFADAVDTYGSAETAAQFVAAPERSRHVSGSAVDIGPVDAQLWLIAHGAQWGLCQIYANERWHFERAAVAGGTCPALRTDASG
jgi:zinc D-Ala-D-Ala carboxypeptidase